MSRVTLARGKKMILELGSDKISALKQRSRNMGHKSSASPMGEIEEMKKDIEELKKDMVEVKSQLRQILILLKQKGIKP